LKIYSIDKLEISIKKEEFITPKQLNFEERKE
jgi:hypothetical protein